MSVNISPHESGAFDQLPLLHAPTIPLVVPPQRKMLFALSMAEKAVSMAAPAKQRETMKAGALCWLAINKQVELSQVPFRQRTSLHEKITPRITVC